MRRVDCIIAAVVILAGPLHGARPINIKFADIKIDKTPTEQEYPDESSVILLKEGAVAFDGKGLVYAEHVVRKILNDRGTQCADIKIPYVKKYSDITEIKARTIRLDGSSTELAQGQFYDVDDFPEYITYAEYKAKKFTMPSVQPGCVIEYLFLKRIKSINIPSWEFQGDAPIVLSRFTLVVPRLLQYKVLKRKGAIDLDIQQSVGSLFGTVAQYIATNVPALRREPFMPPDDDVIPMLKFTLAQYGWLGEQRPLLGSSWRNIGEWYGDVYAESVSKSKSVAAAAVEMTQGCLTPAERARGICEAIRDGWRYVAIEIGEGGYRPNRSSETLNNKYGDCKDLSALTIAALDCAGVPAKIGLLSTADVGVVNKSLCTPGAFNHAVVCIAAGGFVGDQSVMHASSVVRDSTNGKSWLVFDPTAKKVPFGELPWQDKGVDILVVNDTVSDFIATPVGEPGDNVFSSTEEITVLGDAQRRVLTLSYRGLEAVRARRDLGSGSTADNEERIRRRIVTLNPGAVIDSIQYRNTAVTDSSLRIAAHFTINEAGPVVGPRLVGLTVFDDFSRSNPFTEPVRSHDIFFPYPLQHEYRYSITIADPSLEIKTPSDSLLCTDFGGGYYREYWQSQSSSLQGYSQMAINRVWSSRDQYSYWSRIFSMNTQLSQRKILVDRSAPGRRPKAGAKAQRLPKR